MAGESKAGRSGGGRGRYNNNRSHNKEKVQSEKLIASVSLSLSPATNAANESLCPSVILNCVDFYAVARNEKNRSCIHDEGDVSFPHHIPCLTLSFRYTFLYLLLTLPVGALVLIKRPLDFIFF